MVECLAAGSTAAATFGCHVAPNVRDPNYPHIVIVMATTTISALGLEAIRDAHHAMFYLATNNIGRWWSMNQAACNEFTGKYNCVAIP
jgi:hypothetical protein